MGLNVEIDLTADQRRVVLDLIERHLPDTDVWAYGSRVQWTSRPESDLDLVVFSGPGQSGQVADLREALEESDLPFRVDVLVWDELNASLRGEIDREYMYVPLAKSTSGIPSSVEEMRYSEAVTINPRVPLVRGRSYPFVSMANVTSGNRCAKPSSERLYAGSGSRFRVGDTLMARITPSLENGKIARYCARVNDSEYAYGSTEFIVIRGRPGITSDAFAYYLTCCDRVRRYAVSQMTGTSGRQRVPVDALGNCIVSIPDIATQRHIARTLRVLDDKIELNRRTIATLDSLLRAVFRRWFVTYDPVRVKTTGDHTALPKAITDAFPDSVTPSALGPIPSGWTVKALGDLLTLAYGRALNSQNRRHGNVPVYGSNGQVGWHDTALVDGPGIVVGRKGTPGTVTWVPTDFFPIDTTYYVVPQDSRHSLFYMYLALQDQRLSLLVADSAVPGLNRNIAYTQQLAVPTCRVLELFNECVEPFFAAIGQLSAELRLVTLARHLLLHRLIPPYSSNTSVRTRDSRRVCRDHHHE